MKQVSLFQCKKPCPNCPYRTDSPLQHWHISEFKKVIASEKSMLGNVFMCHKKNGSCCIGWLIKQDENGQPSIQLRLALIKNKVTREYLNSLKSPAPLYKSIVEMIKANYPELLNQIAK